MLVMPCPRCHRRHEILNLLELMIPNLPPLRSLCIINVLLPSRLFTPPLNRQVQSLSFNQIFQQRMIKVQIIENISINNNRMFIIEKCFLSEDSEGCTFGSCAYEETVFISEVSLELVCYGLVERFELFVDWEGGCCFDFLRPLG